MIAVTGSDVRIVRSIDDVSAAEWDSVVAPDDVQTGHAFVRACQHSGIEDARYWHLMIHRGGELAGVATLSLVDIQLDLLSTGLTRRAVSAVRRARPSLLRPAVLLCGLPVSAGRPCLAIRDPADTQHVLRAIATAMDRIGAEAGAGLHCVKEFTDREAAALDGLGAHGYFRAVSLPSFRMDIAWHSFEEYLSGMRSGYRRQVNATLHARARNGLRIRRVDDWRSECARIFALYEQVVDRAEFRLERLNQAFFENLAAWLPERTGAILVERDDRLVAAAVLLRSRNQLTFFMAGIDYARNRECSAYLNLVLELVAEAIRTRTPSLELGQTSGALKSRLGARGEARHLYFRCPSTLAHAAFRATSSVLFPLSLPPQRRVFRATARNGVG
jgi:predicted N-acyltransferase